MKSKTFLTLLAVCAVLALASWAVFQGEEEVAGPVGADYFSGLPINEVTALTLTGPDGEVVLEKSGTVWQVESRHGYPADFEEIRKFILKLRDLKVGRTFAADEESRRRLSLLPPDAPEAEADQRGARVAMKKADGETAADLIIGAARETETGNGGHYLMPADGETVFLVDESFRFIELDSAEWLAPDLLDVSPGDVRRVALLNPATGEEQYLIERPEKGEPPAFINPDPAEREGAVIESKVANLFSALDDLTLRDVADPETPADEMGLENPLCHEFWLFDGTTYTVCRGEPTPDSDNERYIRVTAGYRAPPESEPEPEPAPESEAEAEATGETVEETGDAPEEETASGEEAEAPADEASKAAESEPAEEGPDPAQLAAEAEKKNEALSRWTFAVVEWKADRLETDLNEFFETPAPEGEAATESDVIGGGS
ncbi:MAG: DUF4340 domain-containing protein [Thermodesulfobacteriota bacterium]